jgi:chaperone required for assembly of F1-ATPase
LAKTSNNPVDPIVAARRLMRPELPRRFYKSATVGERNGKFAVLLDGRPARTPGRHLLAVAIADVAGALAAEWNAQGEWIDPSAMPLTRLVNAGIDRVAAEMPAVRGEIVKYAGSDLLCYRAEGPPDLVARQEGAWSPLIDWAEQTFDVGLRLGAGVVHVAQAAATLARIDSALADYDALSIAAINAVTTLTGSAIIALAVARGRLDAREAWAGAHVDEDWQMERWGADEAALQRRAARWREMEAAVLILASAR